MSSGVSLPSGVGTDISLRPAIFSGAPHSSTLMCALSAQMTASQRLVIDWSETTLAPVPFITKNTSACSPKCRRKTSLAASV
jgi:hypothetical protein